MLIPVATFHLGLKGNLTTGLGLGLSSLILAFQLGIPKYQLPDISILPRIEMALIIYGLF
ncbi:UNVERIFIED_CONTAM: hypothetical protein O8I53_07570 [Campylobacter lari]